MTTQDRIVVVIAAFNEAKVIDGVVRALVAAGHAVVLVDDGSGDGTAEIARKAGAEVIVHPVNLGQGAALQTGIDVALQAGADFIVTFDADGQHRAADVARLVAALKAANADFALGNRFLGAAVQVTGTRNVLLKAATLFTRFTTGLDIHDTHNGLRAMSRRGASHIRLRQNRMAHASEILHQIAVSQLPFVEVPVTIAYTDYSRAKGQRLVDFVAILIDLFVRRLQR
ncbi:MAG: glycosyltransferase family 2 protein [Pseudorhodoplanes sp.]